jgi:hypothetical protein
MKLHANARLSVKGRELLVDRILERDWSRVRDNQLRRLSALGRDSCYGPITSNVYLRLE